jgi:phosphoribosylaminoimidazolecarboxamide formyltransferase/IMP cyclohydrolase
MIRENQIDCTEVEDLTKFPEIFSGRVKTLQPKIFGGILMRRDEDQDLKEAEANDILPIDLVVVNLYPFPEVVNRTDIDLQTKIENIDIGGPSLIRAAAKNYKFVSVVTNPNQYSRIVDELKEGDTKIETRQMLASEAFSHTSYYDTLIANFFEDEFDADKTAIRLNLPLLDKLRYGENPHQDAFIFGSFNDHYDVLHGKQLSYNNIVDLAAAVEMVLEFEGTSCAIVKHTNPCGAAVSEDVLSAYEAALSCDPVSAFGGIVAFNGTVDSATAEKLNEIFLEIVCAVDFDDDALELLKKKKNRRIVKINKTDINDELLFKSIPGGLIAQAKDISHVSNCELKTVTKAEVSDNIMDDLKFAWIVCKHTKSNAIVYVKNKKAVGVGAGQMSRVDSARLAAQKAKEHGHDLEGAVAASDAFFPFADGLVEIARNRIKAVIQPGGSVRDQEVIDAADENNVAMVFTGVRNFKH